MNQKVLPSPNSLSAPISPPCCDYFAHNEVKLKYISKTKPELIHDVPTDHRVRENQLKALIDKEIADLPPRMCEVFEMSLKQHMIHREIAKQLGTSEETVKKRFPARLRCCV